jgi:hypothetical protein
MGIFIGFYRIKIHLNFLIFSRKIWHFSAISGYIRDLRRQTDMIINGVEGASVMGGIASAGEDLALAFSMAVAPKPSAPAGPLPPGL